MSRYALADGVAATSVDDVVYAAVLPEGPIVVLAGVAALIWEQACAGPAHGLVDRVAGLVQQGVAEPGAAELAAQIAAFVDGLIAQRLLVEAP
ncbi:hypothetical protein LG315_10940 [Microbacterium marinum]|uniref:hypothetical protein n=1 Tax=Microbacterium marinum TaxID=421115 RepID=UPI0038517721